jgi:hypothetical protein
MSESGEELDGERAGSMQDIVDLSPSCRYYQER